jgi:hypothetical protein
LDREVGGGDKKIRPNARHQVLLADGLSSPFKQSSQDLQGTASERHGPVALEQKKLRRKQTKRPKGNFGWWDIGGFGSLLEDCLVHILTLSGVSYVKSRFWNKSKNLSHVHSY